jgi:hypothetical protein
MQLGIAKQTLANLETKGTVGLETAVRAARELGVSIFAVPSSEREPVRRAIEEARKDLKAPASDAEGRKSAGPAAARPRTGNKTLTRVRAHKSAPDAGNR